MQRQPLAEDAVGREALPNGLEVLQRVESARAASRRMEVVPTRSRHSARASRARSVAR
jgi:hypothetical protein